MMNRRVWFVATAAAWAGAAAPRIAWNAPRSEDGTARSSEAWVPTNNPAARYRIAWTDEAKWAQVAVVTNYAGASWDERFAAAQADLTAKGGGVVYFPPGVYAFTNTLRLESHVIVRGGAPAARGVRYERVASARDGEYQPSTRFEFPKFEPRCEGAGTPVSSAFKGIELRDPDTTTHCGVVEIELSHGHIKFGCDVYEIDAKFAPGFRNYGRNHIVYGCRLTHAAIQDPRLPKAWQEPWQRWTHRHNAAIDVRAAANVLVANNQIPESGSGDFPMPGFKIRKGNADTGAIFTRDDIVFRYDNRPGIYVNYGTVQGTPETHPHCFAKGIDIRENYVYCYGCLAIGFSGDGTFCGLNVVRYKPGSYLPIFNGETDSHFTNNNRAIEARGWRWTIAHNDYEVYSNTQYTGEFGGHYGDCEGIMHEAHCNTSIKGSRLLYNVGNRYLCMWRVPMDGLEIRGNIIRLATTGAGGKPAICIQGQVHRADTLHPIRDVCIVDNVTEGGIRLHGLDAGGNLVRGNRHVGPEPASIERTIQGAAIENNENYVVTDRLTYR
jgi:hypothetical protein